MRRMQTVGLLLLAVTTGGALVTYERCPGCLARDRVNKVCDWTGDSRFPIDPRRSADQRHLVADAQLAEELAIRYADAEFGRRFGVEHHGGLIEEGRVRGACLSRMLRAIETHHAVTADQVGIARGQRNRTYDVAVILLFLPLYFSGGVAACRWLRARFSSNEPHARFVATALTSVAAAFLGLQSFRLWGAVWEVIRVGNGHMTSIRAASYAGWTRRSLGVDLVGGILLFWLVALVYDQLMSDEGHPAEGDGPQGMILR